MNQPTSDATSAAGTFICPDCGGALTQRQGPFGAFWGCAGFPKCRYTRPLTPPNQLPILCPACKKGVLTHHQTKNGKDFWGCSTFPHCRMVLWERPDPTPCPKCGHYYMIEKLLYGGRKELRCPSCVSQTPSKHSP